MSKDKSKNGGKSPTPNRQPGYVRDFIMDDVKPERYEKPSARPVPNPVPPKKK